MKTPPKIGDTGIHRFIVAATHAIDFNDGVMPKVLSTPWLIWFLERAAREAIGDLLIEGESSVGTQIEVQHLAPTPLGDTVECTARVIQVDLPQVTFQLEARDSQEMIARGVHRRAIIDARRFAARLQKKHASTERPS